MPFIYYDNHSQFELTEDEFEKTMQAFDNDQSVWVDRLGVHLSPYYKWAGEKPEEQNVGYARENGKKMIKKYGQWKLAEAPEKKIDFNYYNSVAADDLLTKSEAREEFPQKFSDPDNKKKINPPN